MNNINKIFSSVVMPVHNGERFLREAIESVLNQTYKNYEFLIIENCSSDSSLSIIRSYKDDRIKLIIEDDCGQVQAYNRGFKEAKGEYIFIHDHDDISHPKRFEKQLNNMVEKDIDICGSWMRLINERGEVIGSTKTVVEDKKIKKRLLFDCSVIHNSSVCIKKSIFNKVGYWENNNYPVADVEFYLRLREIGVFFNINEVLYSWRKHGEQLSLKKTKKGRETLKKIELDYLSHKKADFKTRDFFYYKSLIFYYTDYLVYSLFYNILAILYGKFDKQAFRYFFILTILGLPLKIFRKFDLLHSKIFLATKAALNKII